MADNVNNIEPVQDFGPDTGPMPMADSPPGPSHIGQDLRRTREEAGLSYEQISQTLRIQAPFLEAIENLDTDELPSIGYVLGYVRAYAKLLGLNPQEVVERYKIDSEVPENLGMRTMPHFVPQRQMRLPRGFFAAILVMIGAVILAVWYGTQPNGPVAVVQGQAGLNTPVVSADENIPVDPDLMMFKAVAPTWVQITDSKGKVIISRILVTGESWQTDVNSNVSLSARDSGALELYIGGEPLGSLGHKGIPMSNVPMPAVPRQNAQIDNSDVTAQDAPKNSPIDSPAKTPAQTPDETPESVTSLSAGEVITQTTGKPQIELQVQNETVNTPQP